MTRYPECCPPCRYTGRHDHGLLPALKSGGPHGELLQSLLVSEAAYVRRYSRVGQSITTVPRDWGSGVHILVYVLFARRNVCLLDCTTVSVRLYVRNSLKSHYIYPARTLRVSVGDGK